MSPPTHNFLNRLTVFVVDPCVELFGPASRNGDNSAGTVLNQTRRYVADQLLNRVIWNRKTDRAGAFLGTSMVHDLIVPTGESVRAANTAFIEATPDPSASVTSVVLAAADKIAAFCGKSRMAKVLMLISPRVSAPDVRAAIAICAERGDIQLQWAGIGDFSDDLLDEFPDHLGLFEDALASIGQPQHRHAMLRRLGGGTTSLSLGGISTENGISLWDVAVELFPATRAAAKDSVHTIGIDADGRDVTVKRSTQYELAQDKPVDEKDPHIKAGYVYGSEIVNADGLDVKRELPEQQFNFVNGPKGTASLDILAIVDHNIAPWVPLGFSNFVVAAPYEPKYALWLSALAQVLQREHKCAIARFRKKDGSDPEIQLLQPCMIPGKAECLMATRLPFKEEYRSHYRFLNLDKAEQAQAPPEIDAAMDEVVDSLTLPTEDIDGDDLDADLDELRPELNYGNPLTHRMAQLVKSRILPDDFAMPGEFVPWTPPDTLRVNSKSAAELVSHFNVHEEIDDKEREQADDYIAPILELDIENLLAGSF